MIQFACHCRHVFTLNDDEAGGLVQCPDCGRLNDVPTLGDLANLAEDGTFKVDSSDPVKEAHRLAELSLVFSKGRTDAQGNEIDLRRTLEDVAQDNEPIDLTPEEPGPQASKPRYDPITGELIRPIDVKEDGPDPSTIPMATATINYASGGGEKRITPALLPVELFRPLNLTVMLFVVIGHYLAVLLGTVALVMPFLIPALLIFQACFLAHYGCVIEETGPDTKDELPRPLRDLRLYDDIWSPLVNVVGSVLLCYLPAALTALYLNTHAPGLASRAWMVLLAAVIGTFFYPAVLLTMSTSGTAANLRPDRLLTVIRDCGLAYWAAVLLWIVASCTYLLALAALQLALLRLFGLPLGLPGRVPAFFIGAGSLLVAVYLMHWFCWHLGLLYRAHHDEFPWVLQRHHPRGDRATRSSAGRAGAAGAAPTDTKARLRELREADRRQRATAQRAPRG